MPSSSDTLWRNFTKLGTGVQCSKGFKNANFFGVQKIRGDILSFRIVFIFVISERIISNYIKMFFFGKIYNLRKIMGSKNIFEIQWFWIQRNIKQWRPYAGPKFWWKMCGNIVHAKPSPGQGGWCNPSWVFLSWTPHRLEDRAEIFHSLWGIICGTFGQKNLVRSCQVTKLWRHKRNNLRKISAKSWVNATWRGAIDLNGDSWWHWCQYMTGCDPWHCDRWGSRSNKVTWGHWPRLTSQWQITNQHMFSGVSWGAESESMVHCP